MPTAQFHSLNRLIDGAARREPEALELLHSLCEEVAALMELHDQGVGVLNDLHRAAEIALDALAFAHGTRKPLADVTKALMEAQAKLEAGRIRGTDRAFRAPLAAKMRARRRLYHDQGVLFERTVRFLEHLALEPVKKAIAVAGVTPHLPRRDLEDTPAFRKLARVNDAMIKSAWTALKKAEIAAYASATRGIRSLKTSARHHHLGWAVNWM